MKWKQLPLKGNNLQDAKPRYVLKTNAYAHEFKKIIKSIFVSSWMWNLAPDVYKSKGLNEIFYTFKFQACYG